MGHKHRLIGQQWPSRTNPLLNPSVRSSWKAHDPASFPGESENIQHSEAGQLELVMSALEEIDEPTAGDPGQ